MFCLTSTKVFGLNWFQSIHFDFLQINSKVFRIIGISNNGFREKDIRIMPEFDQ
jgi:hypothetical protein